MHDGGHPKYLHFDPSDAFGCPLTLVRCSWDHGVLSRDMNEQALEYRVEAVKSEHIMSCTQLRSCWYTKAYGIALVSRQSAS